MEGWLYVMWNENLRTGVIKIGRTNDLRQHTQDLYTAGVPSPFRLAYRGLVDNFEEIEKTVHTALAEYRISSERDFFECPVAKAILTIRESAHVVSEDVYFKDEEEIEREQDKRKQKRILEDHNAKQKKTRDQYIETEGIWLDKPSFYVTVFLGLVAFIIFPDMDEYFRDNSAIKWFLAAIPPFIYWHFASRSYTSDYHELSRKADRMYPMAKSYDDIPAIDLDADKKIHSSDETDDSSFGADGKPISEAEGTLLGDGVSEGKGVDVGLYAEDGSVPHLTQAKISWVCHYCATDNLSDPANELFCIRCNKASSIGDIL